jgi:GTP-binding protein Era
MNQPPAGFRAGFVALVGRPNVGKSTLVNALVGEKVAIVSPKPQTTRTRVHGIINRPDAQIVLVDTPGLSLADSALRKAMSRTTSMAAADADHVLLVAECRQTSPSLTEADRAVVEMARKTRGTIVVALNKVDLLGRKESLLPWMQLWQSTLSPTAIVPISARSSDGLDRLLAELVKVLPESPPLFPTDLHTDQAERFLCGELVREQLFLQLREEVPYATAVVIESFEDERREDGAGLVRIEGRIYVERESQKGIVVGKGGAAIKAISQEARVGIEALLGCKVFLRVTVHVDPEWTDNDREVRRFGYGPGGEGEAW